MILAGLIFGSPAWQWACWAFLLAACGVVWYGLSAYRYGPRLGYLPAACKLFSLSLIAACLTEPLWSSVRTRPGANLFLMLIDDSASLQIHDAHAEKSRGEQLQDLLANRESGWQTRLAQEFDVRQFAVNSRLESLQDIQQLQFQSPHSSWYLALRQIGQRFAGRPIAGIFVMTDGIVTDERPPGWSSNDLPPIYPVMMGNGAGLNDLAVNHVAVSTTAFEDAPVTLLAEISHQGGAGRNVVARVLDDRHSVVKEETLQLPSADRATSVRFQIRPVQPGLSFYTLQVQSKETDNAQEFPEATTANNTRRIVVDRGNGPYRVLYIGGRPNWEYKFLNRALAADEQVKLTGLLRIAKREPKFDWRGRAGESSNPLFRGFDGVDAETEPFDQPVMVRLNTKDATELRDGFPKTADELYPFLAVIIDDIEAEFFTPSQLELLERFVSERGGSVLMLGGMESFVPGGYRRTPLARVLPISLEESPSDSAVRRFKLNLTREGWLQPWARLRSTEEDETARLKKWPAFHTLNTVGREKPGATVIAEAVDATGEKLPAVVAHRYGEGRCAAVLIGDLWRAQMQQAEDDGQTDDLSKSWRQLLRWLIADVPDRIELRAVAVEDDPSVMRIEARIKAADFQPQDNSSVVINATSPDGTVLTLPAEPSLAEAGLYEALLAVTKPGAYQAEVHVTSDDGTSIGTGVTGWVHDPLTEEFRRVAPDRDWLAELAQQTGGELVEANQLQNIVEHLTRKPAPITEFTTTPLWQHPVMLVLIMAGLCSEWGLRRWRGLP